MLVNMKWRCDECFISFNAYFAHTERHCRNSCSKVILLVRDSDTSKCKKATVKPYFYRHVLELVCPFRTTLEMKGTDLRKTRSHLKIEF